MSSEVHSAFQGMRNDAMTEWKNTKGALARGGYESCPFVPAWQASGEQRTKLTPQACDGAPAGLAAHQAIDQAENMLWSRALERQSSHRLRGLDQLKQEIWEMSQGQYKGQQAENAFKDVHAGVRKAISDYSPEYNNLMEGYQTHFTIHSRM